MTVFCRVYVAFAVSNRGTRRSSTKRSSKALASPGSTAVSASRAANPNVLVSVPGEGFEPSRSVTEPAGLSRLRLPFRHPGLGRQVTARSGDVVIHRSEVDVDGCDGVP